MDKKPAGSTRASNSEGEEDPIEALTGNLSNFLPPSGATHLNRTARGRFRVTIAERLFAEAKKALTEDGLMFDPANFAEDELDEMLEKFFETSAPSKVNRSDGIGWIRVFSASKKPEEFKNLEDLEADWKKLQKSRQNIDFNAVKQLAISHRCLIGIWLLFFDTGEEIDNAWEKIARATVRDELGTHAKVTPCVDTKEGKALYATASQEQHVVSVYTKDFTDKEDVMKVEAVLRKLGFRERITFKPGVYSKLGVFSQNQWGLRPSIYTSNWDPRKLAGNIRDCTKSRVTYMINDQ
ncbi:UPF0696 protein C11orf68 homolog [Patiria miniata]|uniref:DUF1917-domain-containing protein n=1 Tax=Patiria miniata TaxID=46514 RepID=A0A914AQF6_PATMI|nr:UPF0696 protein C11orf68 homolog [Patiria miniata]XP_038066000.1 UPF0696 protein C11orf68 homolog [Patiria miniata]